MDPGRMVLRAATLCNNGARLLVRAMRREVDVQEDKFSRTTVRLHGACESCIKLAREVNSTFTCYLLANVVGFEQVYSAWKICLCEVFRPSTYGQYFGASMLPCLLRLVGNVFG